tara:strand:- start:1095 stop:1565 length:471 start_codon:yes stop_codon:yes gene_type:complete
MPKPTPFKIISDIVSKTTHPWEYEPDLYEWIHRGIECIARRNMQTGSWCGYVDVPREVWDKLDSDLPRAEWVENELNVHGGVTYSENNLDKDAKRIGFDCTHAGDKMPKMFNAETPMANKIFENDVYRDLAFVIAECESMVDQILKITGGDVGDKP